MVSDHLRERAMVRVARRGQIGLVLVSDSCWFRTRAGFGLVLVSESSCSEVARVPMNPRSMRAAHGCAIRTAALFSRGATFSCTVALLGGQGGTLRLLASSAFQKKRRKQTVLTGASTSCRLRDENTTARTDARGGPHRAPHTEHRKQDGRCSVQLGLCSASSNPRKVGARTPAELWQRTARVQTPQPSTAGALEADERGGLGLSHEGCRTRAVA